MDWRLKMLLQNVIAALPDAVSNGFYYNVQRAFGGLNNINPMEWFKAAVEFADKMHSIEKIVAGKRIIELGTGRRVNFPIACWLMGADKVTTIDLNTYLRPGLIVSDMQYICKNLESIKALFGHRIYQDRLTELVGFISGGWTVDELLSRCSIEYLSPADARAIPADDGYFDIHLSFNVLEHIPKNILKDIFREGKRVLNSDGSFVHRVDFSDHFSHSDQAISGVNFLKFSDQQWKLLAGNRFMYMNRLRVDDFLQLFTETGLNHVLFETTIDAKAADLLRNGKIRPTTQFLSKSIETLATNSSWHIMKKATLLLTAIITTAEICLSLILLQEV